MNEQKILVIIVVCLFLLLYTQSYAKYHDDYKIIQSNLRKIDIGTLYEKYPIVIYDRVISPQQLLDTLFSYSYAVKSEIVESVQNPCMNMSKYLILFNSLDDSVINLVNPKFRKNIEWRKQNGTVVSTKHLDNLRVQYVTIKLKKNQVLILPGYWIYQVDKKIKKIALNDLFGFFYYGFSKAAVRKFR